MFHSTEVHERLSSCNIPAMCQGFVYTCKCGTVCHWHRSLLVSSVLCTFVDCY